MTNSYQRSETVYDSRKTHNLIYFYFIFHLFKKPVYSINHVFLSKWEAVIQVTHYWSIFYRYVFLTTGGSSRTFWQDCRVEQYNRVIPSNWNTSTNGQGRLSRKDQGYKQKTDFRKTANFQKLEKRQNSVDQVVKQKKEWDS